MMRYLEDVVTLAYDKTLCNGCRRCLQVCPHAVFTFENKHAVLSDRGACMECGACANNCEARAISVKSGVGCAAGVLTGWATGGEPTCDCSNGSACC